MDKTYLCSFRSCFSSSMVSLPNNLTNRHASSMAVAQTKTAKNTIMYIPRVIFLPNSSAATGPHHDESFALTTPYLLDKILLVRLYFFASPLSIQPALTLKVLKSRLCMLVVFQQWLDTRPSYTMPLLHQHFRI